ncbi:MAG: hypothetical protein KGH64_02495 [Candidatus Micrarchaeota archaeon]|nr:hypothetical protein [Candidatus Micrarchaeota archaeon]MDE1834184.1 hypothetical protein [Candidatus Micrarchaeota archaeon]
MLKKNAVGFAAILVIIYFVANYLAGKGSVGSYNHSFVNVTSITVRYYNLTSVDPSGMPSSFQINQSGFLPSNTVLEKGIVVAPGSNVTLDLVTSYTFNGQLVEFIVTTPGFSIQNSTYLFNKTQYINATSLPPSQINVTQTVIETGSSAGYTINLLTPRNGYYGNLDIIEVINNVDRSKVLVANLTS